jgi:acyl-CoA thioester hydrolase
MTDDTAFTGYTSRVRREWCDYNGHMNVAYYVIAFDEATDAFYDWMGLDRAYRERSGCSSFTLEGHITWERELLEGDPIRVRSLLLDFDAKRLHYFHEMYHAEKGYLASSHELLAIHIDMSARRSAPMPADTMARLAEVKAAHALLPRPPQIGRTIGLKSGRAS